MDRMQPETLMRSLLILMTCSASLLSKGTRRFLGRTAGSRPCRLSIRVARGVAFFLFFWSLPPRADVDDDSRRRPAVGDVAGLLSR